MKPQQSVLWPVLLTVAQHDGIDRADRCRLRRELVEMVDHRLLEWMRDVEAGKTGLPGTGQHIAERMVGKVERVEIDQRVTVVQPKTRPFPLMHDRRSR